MPNLEQSCVRPGLWLIEGRTVRRRRHTGHIKVICDRVTITRTWWEVDHFGDITYVDTLRQARELIADQVCTDNYGR